MYKLPLDTVLHDLYALKQGYEPDGVYPACLDVAIELCKERIAYNQRVQTTYNKLRLDMENDDDRK